LSCLLTRQVAWDGSAAGGTTRPPRSALREQTPIAVSELADQYLMRRFDATRHVGAFVVPVAPRERPWFSFGGLQGRLVGSTAVRFSMQTVRAVLSRARALRAITRSAPARPPRRAPRNQPMASAKEARNHGADGSRCYGQPRSYPTGWKTVHRLISFGSAAV
jgi:hypothetical protein